MIDSTGSDPRQLPQTKPKCNLSKKLRPNTLISNYACKRRTKIGRVASNADLNKELSQRPTIEATPKHQTLFAQS